MKLEEAIQEIKRQTDLAQIIGLTVKLKKQGNHYLGLCPFHSEKTPSFNVRPDKGYFKCFGCGAGGDVFEFLQKTTGQLFIDIVKSLAAEQQIKIDSNFRPRPVNSAVSKSLTQQQESYKNQLVGKPLEYLVQQRAYPKEFLEKLGLGFAGTQSGLFSQRITIPIRNTRGQVVGFGARIWNETQAGKPKYVNSPASEIYDKSRTLYGLYESLPLIKKQKRVVLVEGYFDVMALLVNDIPAAAPCGTSLTESHIDLLKKYTNRVLLCFDQDQAGKSAHEKALVLFLTKGFRVETVELKDKDPDALWQKGEKEALKRLFDKPKDAIEISIQNAFESSLGGIQKRITAIQSLLPTLAASPEPLVNRQYIRLTAQVFNEDESLLLKSVRNYRPGSIEITRPELLEKENPILWSDSEKLLLRTLLAHPAILQNKAIILETGLNSQLTLFVSNLLDLLEREPNLQQLGQNELKELTDNTEPSFIRHLSEISQNSPEISFEQSNLIIDGWLKQIERKKLQAKLQEEQKELLKATQEGDLERIHRSLQNQSGALKKGWA